MSAIPEGEHGTTAQILRWWERQADKEHRPHLGASLIGEPCERKLWLTFRWAKAQDWEGRMLRLFDDGKRAEARFVQELRGIGCEVWEFDDSGRQFRVSAHGGHFGGSLDAVVSGLPEAPKTPHVAEFKTSNDKLFKALSKTGVEQVKPLHYAQMQIYMGLMDLDRAFYLVENKNDASLYGERVKFDPNAFELLMAKAKRVIEATEPPPKIGESAEDFVCKWCSFSDLCHGSQAAEVNCRTCARSTPITEGEGAGWQCSLPKVGVIPIATQRKGCDRHLYIPPLLRNVGEPVDGGEEHVVYRTPEGEFTNGPSPWFSSQEIYDCKHKPVLADQVVQDIKAQVKTARLVSGTAFDDMPDDDFMAAPTRPEHPAKVSEKKKVRAAVAALKASEVPY